MYNLTIYKKCINYNNNFILVPHNWFRYCATFRSRDTETPNKLSSTHKYSFAIGSTNKSDARIHLFQNVRTNYVMETPAKLKLWIVGFVSLGREAVTF